MVVVVVVIVATTQFSILNNSHYIGQSVHLFICAIYCAVVGTHTHTHNRTLL